MYEYKWGNLMRDVRRRTVATDNFVSGHVSDEKLLNYIQTMKISRIVTEEDC